jgi:hypothetical protein
MPEKLRGVRLQLVLHQLEVVMAFTGTLFTASIWLLRTLPNQKSRQRSTIGSLPGAWGAMEGFL